MTQRLSDFFNPKEGKYCDVQNGRIVPATHWTQEASIRTINYLAQHLIEQAVPENKETAKEMLESLKQFPENVKAKMVLKYIAYQNADQLAFYTQLSPKAQEVIFTSDPLEKILLFHELDRHSKNVLRGAHPVYANLYDIDQSFGKALPAICEQMSHFVQEDHIFQVLHYLLVPGNQFKFKTVLSYLKEPINPNVLRILLLRRFIHNFHFETDLYNWSMHPNIFYRAHRNLAIALSAIRSQDDLNEINDAFTTYKDLLRIPDSLLEKRDFIASLVAPGTRYLFNNPFEIEHSIKNLKLYRQELLLESAKTFPSKLNNRPITISLEKIRKSSSPLRQALNQYLRKVFASPQFLTRVTGKEKPDFPQSLTTYLTNRLYLVVGLEHEPALQMDSYNLPESVVKERTEVLLQHFCDSCLGDDLAGVVRETLGLSTIEEADELLFKEKIFLPLGG